MRRFITLLFVAGAFAQDDTKLASAVDDLVADRNVTQARAVLESFQDRAAVVAALKRTLDRDGFFKGKLNVLRTLSKWSPRTVRAALDSKSRSSRRAAAWVMHTDPSAADKVRKIVVDWLKDEKADGRPAAAMIAGSVKIEECVPALERAIGTPKTEAEIQFASQALASLAKLKPDGFAKRALAIAEDENQHWRFRGSALSVIAKLEDAPIARVRSLLLGIIEDRDGNNILRNMAAAAVRAKRLASPELHARLEKVVLRDGDDSIIQRACLYALGATAPLKQLRKLLLDRRVYNHRYFGIRVDVASGLAALHVQEKIALEIMCTYMVDEDPQDKDLLVSQEGFLTFWALTGMAVGVAEARLFQRAPKAIPNVADIRKYLWYPSFLRAGVSHKMVEAVQQLTTSNLAEVKSRVRKGIKRPAKKFRKANMQRVAQISRSKIDQLLEIIRKAKEAAERKR